MDTRLSWELSWSDYGDEDAQRRIADGICEFVSAHEGNYSGISPEFRDEVRRAVEYASYRRGEPLTCEDVAKAERANTWVRIRVEDALRMYEFRQAYPTLEYPPDTSEEVLRGEERVPAPRYTSSTLAVVAALIAVGAWLADAWAWLILAVACVVAALLLKPRWIEVRKEVPISEERQQARIDETLREVRRFEGLLDRGVVAPLVSPPYAIVGRPRVVGDPRRFGGIRMLLTIEAGNAGLHSERSLRIPMPWTYGRDSEEHLIKAVNEAVVRGINEAIGEMAPSLGIVTGYARGS